MTRTTLQQLADTAKVVVWMTDAQNNVIYLNQENPVASQWAAFTISEWASFIHPEDLPGANAIFRQAVNERTDYRIEYRLLTSTGRMRWMMGLGSPRFTASGEFAGYNGTILDISLNHEAQERLIKSEAEHRLLTESSADLISHYSNDSTFVYASPSYSRVLGYEEGELIGRNVREMVHPEDIDAIRQDIAAQIDGRHDGHTVELRKRHKRGHYVWMGTRARVLMDPETNTRIGTVAFSRDIAAEREARNVLRKREERFRSLTNLSADWYWETDEADRFTFVSEGIERVSGFMAQDFLGKTRLQLSGRPDDGDLLEYYRKVEAREAFRGLRYAVTGGVPGLLRIMSVSGEPVFVDGVFTGYRGIGRDISDGVAVAEELLRLADENQALIENSLDIMLVMDGEGLCLQVNGAVTDILGYKPSELRGRAYLDFVTPEDRERNRAIAAGLRTGKNTVHDFESRWLHKNGDTVHLSSAVRWSHDRKAMYGTLRDVTERHRIRAQLQQSKDEVSTVLESIGDAFFAVDRNWRINYVNQKAADFVHMRRENMVGRRLSDAVPELPASPIFAYYERAMANCQDVFFEEYYAPQRAWVEVRVYAHADGLSVFFHDISARRETEAAVRAGELRRRKVIELTPAGYVLTNAQGMLEEVNPAVCAMTGFEEIELIGRDVMELLPLCPLDGALFETGGATSVHGKEAVIRHKDGHSVHVLVNVSIERDEQGNALSLTAFMTDISERKQAQSRLENLATHDSLTGLPNRALVNAQLETVLGAQQAGHSIAVMFIDLDRFKEVNDAMGHAPGDMLLRQTASRLQGVMRPSDVIARLGGDEFIAVVACSAGRKSAEVVAGRLLEALGAPFDIGGHEVYISASIGISMAPEDGNSNEVLFQNADTAMYRAKAAGRNGFCFYEPRMSAETRDKVTIEHALRRALERNEFELYYQPRINLKTMRVTGMEALIRWNSPVLGRVPPMRFIPIAEERGFIEAIGKWVLNEACRESQRLMEKFGLTLNLSVNLSARQLKCVDLVEQVSAALRSTQLPPHLLELELTETALIEDVEVSAAMLAKLKALGLRLSVDDFGTGYSALAYLRRFPLDILKLDRSFLYQQEGCIGSFEFVKAFIDMAHALGLSVVAEGVEDNEAVQFLRESACDEAQGYLFARPLSLAQFEEYLSHLPT
jgi:diguanylate cyclase (GGDEF)-like protein/PAS domain S-box-containing protein